MPRRPTGVSDEVRGATGGATKGGVTKGGVTKGGVTARTGAGSNRCTGGGAGARAGVGIAGRGANAGGGATGGATAGAAAGAAATAAGVGGRIGDNRALDIGGAGTSGGRAWVVRCVGDSGARGTPGTGGVNLGISGGRATGCATGGVGGGTMGGGVCGGTMGGGGTVGGVLAVGVARAALGIAGISPVVRLARATTPGVKIGVGFRRCGGGANGVANGIEVRGAAGVGTRGVSIERRGAGGSNASGAASASDSITARSFAAQAAPGTAMAAEARAGVGSEAPSIPTRITAPHTEHRARTPPGGTFEGSTRNTD